MSATPQRGLSDVDRREIERLALAMTKPTPAKIARKIGRHVGTVNWFMIRQGLVDRTISYSDGKLSYMQGGRLVHRYTRQHDERICELRRDGKNARQIAEAVTTEFGIKRSPHSIDVRLTMLGAYEGGPEQ